VVLFFYEQNCPRCAGLIPERNDIVEQYRDQPVTFIAIAAGDTADQAKAYLKRTGLVMPIFADKLSLMEKLYGTKISLNNIYQFRVIDAAGNIVGYNMDKQSIDRALAGVKLPHSAKDYHEELAQVVAALNIDMHSIAMRELRRYLNSKDEAVKASAEALSAAVVEQAKGWVEQADALVQTDPIHAGKLYDQASDLFPKEDFGKDARTKLNDLMSSPAVKDETAARKMYAKMISAIDKMKPNQTPELIAYAKKIAEEYPDTPTGKRCAELAVKIGG
jgi:thiol-disulfide isomerase/thioredoxin